MESNPATVRGVSLPNFDESTSTVTEPAKRTIARAISAASRPGHQQFPLTRSVLACGGQEPLWAKAAGARRARPAFACAA